MKNMPSHSYRVDVELGRKGEKLMNCSSGNVSVVFERRHVRRREKVFPVSPSAAITCDDRNKQESLVYALDTQKAS